MLVIFAFAKELILVKLSMSKHVPTNVWYFTIVLHMIDTDQNHVDILYFIIHAHMESSLPWNLVCSGMLHPGMPQFQSKVFQGEACPLSEPDSGLRPDKIKF